MHAGNDADGQVRAYGCYNLLFGLVKVSSSIPLCHEPLEFSQENGASPQNYPGFEF